MKKIPMTLVGFNQLKHELQQLKAVERPAIIMAIEEARSHGDLSENAEYHTAREKQSFIEGRIQDLEKKISQADVIDPSKINGNTVTFAATVDLKDDETGVIKTYQIVGEEESDITKGLLSISSPLGRAVIGKKVGDVAEAKTPAGERFYEIIKIRFI